MLATDGKDRWKYRHEVGSLAFLGWLFPDTRSEDYRWIAAAIVSGEYAGQAAARFLHSSEAGALKEFEAEIRDQFEVSITRAKERRQWLNQQWHTAAAQEDAMHRKGWVAFPEYFLQ